MFICDSYQFTRYHICKKWSTFSRFKWNCENVIFILGFVCKIFSLYIERIHKIKKSIYHFNIHIKRIKNILMLSQYVGSFISSTSLFCNFRWYGISFDKRSYNEVTFLSIEKWIVYYYVKMHERRWNRKMTGCVESSVSLSMPKAYITHNTSYCYYVWINSEKKDIYTLTS